MNNSVLPTNEGNPGKRLRTLVYFAIAVTVLLGAATVYLMYERINEKVNAKDDYDTKEDGGWTTWENWAYCSLTCGSGTQSRARACSSPTPNNGGDDCIGDSTETKACSVTDCPGIPSDCKDILQNDIGTSDGVYSVTLNQTGERIEVYCDMTTDGGGWTVFQKRFNGSVDFYLNHRDYEDGFGSVYGEFWLGLNYIACSVVTNILTGLKYIFKMTNGVTNELRFDVEKSTRERGNAVYQSFSLSGPSNYTLHVGEYSGTAGDGLSRNNGSAFTTPDRDVGRHGSNCGVLDHGGWWYMSCTHVNLNGEYVTPGTLSSYHNGYGGVIYTAFDELRSLKSTEMKFRRKN